MTARVSINPEEEGDNSSLQESKPVIVSDSMMFDRDDDMINPDNHLDDDDRYYLFPGPSTD